MKIGFTGTQRGLTFRQKVRLADYVGYAFRDLKSLEFHHGCCIGADEAFHDLIVWFGLIDKLILHPPLNMDKVPGRLLLQVPTDQIRPPAEYLVRNKQIVKEVKTLIVCPYGKKEVMRSGTWSTLRYAERRGNVNILLWPGDKK